MHNPRLNSSQLSTPLNTHLALYKSHRSMSRPRPIKDIPIIREHNRKRSKPLSSRVLHVDVVFGKGCVDAVFYGHVKPDVHVCAGYDCGGIRHVSAGLLVGVRLRVEAVSIASLC